jgi:hypothetical protein
MKIHLLSCLGLLLGLGLGVAAAQFDGSPPSPLAFTSHPEFAAWDVQVHSRDVDTWGDDAMDPVGAGHGPDCGAPPATHHVTSYRQAVYICRDHLMTAIHGGGYGVIVLTPNRLLDWSGGQATVTWDMSTHRESTRDWVDFWLASWQDQIALPISDAPDIQPSSKRPGQWLQINGHGNITGFRAANHKGVVANYGPVYQADSSAQRDKFQIKIDRQKFSFCKISGEPNGRPLCFFENVAHGLSATQAVFQIGHHSYTPTKGDCFQPSCAQKGSESGKPGTWHWDNVELRPSVPFTVIHADKRAVLGKSGTVTFDAPAPAGAFLRFSAVGKVSVDGVEVQPQLPTSHPETANSYFIPIAAGKRSVRIELAKDGWYGGPFHAKDFAIWHKGGSGAASVPRRPIMPPRGEDISPPNTGDAGLAGMTDNR